MTGLGAASMDSHASAPDVYRASLSIDSASASSASSAINTPRAAEDREAMLSGAGRPNSLGGAGGGVPNTPRPDLLMKAGAGAKDAAGGGRGGAPDLFAVPELVGEQRARGGRALFVGGGRGAEASSGEGPRPVGAIGEPMSNREGADVGASEADGLFTPMREGKEGYGVGKEAEDGGVGAHGPGRPGSAQLQRGHLFRCAHLISSHLI